MSINSAKVPLRTPKKNCTATPCSTLGKVRTPVCQYHKVWFQSLPKLVNQSTAKMVELVISSSMLCRLSLYVMMKIQASLIDMPY